MASACKRVLLLQPSSAAAERVFSILSNSFNSQQESSLEDYTELSVILQYNKWKIHFYEMKGDVGMSLHEKDRNKKMPTPRHKVTHNPIPTSLFCFNMLFVCLL